MQAKITACAQAAHEANRAYCIALNDHSQRSWEGAFDWQKHSAIEGVKAILANPDTTPEQSHEGWLKQKVADGWVYGEHKDVEKKTHPCMVPYNDLPMSQQAKDHIFGTTVRALAKALGLLP